MATTTFSSHHKKDITLRQYKHQLFNNIRSRKCCCVKRSLKMIYEKVRQIFVKFANISQFPDCHKHPGNLKTHSKTFTVISCSTDVLQTAIHNGTRYLQHIMKLLWFCRLKRNCVKNNFPATHKIKYSLDLNINPFTLTTSEHKPLTAHSSLVQLIADHKKAVSRNIKPTTVSRAPCNSGL